MVKIELHALGSSELTILVFELFLMGLYSTGAKASFAIRGPVSIADVGAENAAG